MIDLENPQALGPPWLAIRKRVATQAGDVLALLPVIAPARASPASGASASHAWRTSVRNTDGPSGAVASPHQ